MRLVICGSAAGTVSARAGAYYANPQNRFWRTLFETGLTPRLFQPCEFPELAAEGIGLTDLGKKTFGMDRELPSGAYDRDALRARIQAATPNLLAFNGKAPARAFFGAPVTYGLQTTGIGHTRVFVLPSTSPTAVRYWDAQHWHDLALAYRSLG
jgi:TDG/mug DNA glycosylase family protein